MGMGMGVSPQIWQQFIDLVFQDDLIKHKQNFDVIMDDMFIHSTAKEHMDDLIDLFKVLRKYGLKLSPHKCQFFKKKIVYMGLEFQIHEDKVCYTPLKDKCEAIQNLESTKTLRQTRAFCGMVNFLSSFLPNLCRLLIPIYDLQKKAKKFKWTEEAERAFNDIKKLLINPPVLKAPTPDGLFPLESDTSREGVGGTLLQKQGDEWVVIGYHSKRLPKSAKNFGVTVNIYGFMQLLCNRDFEVLVDHKAIEYMIKSKTESPMTRLKTLLLKLSKYTIDLKYQKGSEMHTSDTLSRLHNFMDTPDQKDIIPLNFLQHFTLHYTEHLYSHLVENLYAHKTKTLDTIPVKGKCSRPPKPKSQILSSNPRTLTEHIPRQSDTDKIVRNIETCVIHSLELPIQAQDLIKAYQHSTHFCDIYQYITDGKLPSSTKVQNCIRARALNYVVINHFLFRIDTRKDEDADKGNSFLLVIPEKYEPIIFNTYHDSLLAEPQVHTVQR